jgi:hypothetical protein
VHSVAPLVSVVDVATKKSPRAFVNTATNIRTYVYIHAYLLCMADLLVSFPLVVSSRTAGSMLFGDVGSPRSQTELVTVCPVDVHT